MTLRLTRRIVFICTIVAFAFMTVVPLAGTESAIETIAAMENYLSSAVSLFSVTQAYAKKVEPKGLKQQDRDAVHAELQKLMRALDSLLDAKGTFIGDLDDYIRMVKADSFDSSAQMKRYWQMTLDSIAKIVTATQGVLDIVTRPDSKLDIVVADADLVNLRLGLNQRITLLSRFQAMPPPRTKGEIAQLAIMADRYDKLRQTAEQLRFSLATTLRKFRA
jgi:hypothetical protein